MSAPLTRALLTASLVTGLSFTLPACGGSDDDTGGTGSTGTDDFAEAIPDTETLALTLDDADDAAAPSEAGLENAGALTGEPSHLRRLTRGVFERVNALREQAQARVAALIEGVEPETFTEGKFDCKRWSVDNETVHWQLTSCQKDKKNRHYAFALKGRPLDAGDDALVAVMAGEGKVLARFDDKKRGSGKVGFDFDALAALTGQEGPAGQLGIGFRAAGKVRQLNVGLRDFARMGDETPLTGLYRYKHILEVGGRVSLLAHGDVLARDENDALIQGEDGQEELVRAVLAWNRGAGARAAAAACGGTVGEGVCERIVQCWRADGVVSHEMSDDQAEAERGAHREHARARWEQSMCPAVAAGIEDVEDAPAPEDFEVPAGDAVPEEPVPADGE